MNTIDTRWAEAPVTAGIAAPTACTASPKAKSTTVFRYDVRSFGLNLASNSAETIMMTVR